MQDANLHRTTYGYDETNRLTRETDPEDRSTTTAYDDLASRVTVTRPDLTTVVKQLDELGRTASLTRSDGAVSYGYDAASQLRTMADPSGTTTYDYDNAGRVSSVASPQGTLGYGYDAAGRRSRVDYPGSRSVNYAFDPAGRMWTLTDWASKTVTYGYDDAGRKTSQSNPNGTSSAFSYDLAGRLGSVTHLSGGNTIASFAYTPDPAGNPLSVAEVMSLVPGGTSSYSYDSLSRLRTVTYPDTTWSSYLYDPMGNRTELGIQGGSTTYAYDRSDRLLSTAGQQSLTFGWDTRGNQTAKGTQTFTYDQANRLVTSNTGSSAAYSYNGEGVRIGKTVGGVTTSYLQDQVGGLPMVLVETTGEQQTLFVYGAGLAFEVRPDGTRRYYHTDALGSTRVVTDDGGTVVSAFNYDAYGTLRQSAGEARSFTYTGEEVGTESGFVFLRARYYDQGTGRFLTKDPVAGKSASPQTLNRYAYAHDNPTGYVDPTGNQVQILVGIIAGGGISYGSQVVNNIRNGGFTREAFTDVDWRQVGAGAIAGGVGAATFGLGTAAMGTVGVRGIGANVAVNVLSGRAADVAANAVMGECNLGALTDWDSIGLDALSPLSGPMLGRLSVPSLATSAASSSLSLVSSKTLASKPRQVHHLASDKHSTYTPRFREITDRYNLDLNADWNKVTIQHQGRHPNDYHNFVLSALQAAHTSAAGDAEKFLQYFRENVGDVVAKDPTILTKAGWR